MRTLILLVLIFIAEPAAAMPDIDVEYGKTLDGFARVRVVNNTPRNLACYVGIDGYKIKFVLGALKPSIWYKATDKRFNYTNFTTWCDYLELYPQFQKYQEQ